MLELIKKIRRYTYCYNSRNMRKYECNNQDVLKSHDRKGHFQNMVGNCGVIVRGAISICWSGRLCRSQLLNGWLQKFY